MNYKLKVLGIETSNITGGVAFLKDTKLLKESHFTRGMVHGRLLIPAIEKGLKQLRWKLNQIDLIAVDIGPGSYTGLRVGVTAAKTISYAIKQQYPKSRVGLVGVVSLDAMVENIPTKYEYVCPIIDARWNQVYTALYKKAKEGYKQVSPPRASLPTDLIKELPKEVFIFGDGLSRYKEVFNRNDIISGEERFWYPQPRHIARLGLKLFKAGIKTDPFRLNPLYLRPTEAELKNQ